MGRVARMGVQPRWAQAWPWAKILLPEHHLCPCLGLLGVYRFFFACIESLQRFLKWWINAQPHFISIFFMATSELCSLSCFLVCHQPPLLTVTSKTPQDVAFSGSGKKWCTATPLVCFLISAFFFFANFLFAVQSMPSTLLANGHSPPLPRGPTSSNY